MFYIKLQDGQELFLYEIVYIKISPSSGCYVSAKEEEAQGIVVNGVPYSINTKNPISGIETAIIVKQKEWTEEINLAYQNKLCQDAKERLLPELSSACSKTINAGAKVKLSNGEESFTYDINDQANVSEMFNAIIMGATQYPYHANGEACKMYSAADIISIYTTLSLLKTGQITYHNQLKQYVNSLTKLEDINSIEYGQELTGIYLENYNNIMGQVMEQMQNVTAFVLKQ